MFLIHRHRRQLTCYGILYCISSFGSIKSYFIDVTQYHVSEYWYRQHSSHFASYKYYLHSVYLSRRAPVIIGTIFAIRKDYFFEVGAFDEDMQLWGGENLDLPVRVS